MLVFFPPHNEDKFPLSNEMSCLHFWAGTKLPLPQRKNQTQGLAVLFKSQRNRFKLVECLHIPLAIWVMFQSKRKLAEEMLSLGTQSCFHAIHVPQLSQSEALNLSYLSSTSCLSLLHPHTFWHSHLSFCSLSVALSPRYNSSVNWLVEILANVWVNWHCCCTRKQCWGVPFKILI